MIIQNGTIEPKVKTAGGIDPETGHPVKATTSWGDSIPCQYVPNNCNQLGQVQGEHFTLATYEVYIEEQPFTAEQVRMKDCEGNVIGEYSITSVELLQAVGEIRILI